MLFLGVVVALGLNLYLAYETWHIEDGVLSLGWTKSLLFLCFAQELLSSILFMI